MWLGSLWTAGDAKLFIAYAALIPLSVYSYGYVKWFPAITLLMNTFVPIFIFFFLLLMFKTSLEQKKEALKPLVEPKQLINSFFSLFALFWLIELLFPLVGIVPNYFFKMIGSIIVFSILQTTLKKNMLGAAIVISSIRLIVDKSVYNLLFIEKIFGLFLFWFIFKGVITNLGQKTFSKKIEIKELKAGMLPAETVYEDNKRYFKEGQEHQMISTEKKSFLELSAGGLTKENIEKLKQLRKEKRLKFNSLKIKQTLPFAPFMLLGVLVTLISEGNFLVIVNILRSFNIIDFLRSRIMPILILGTLLTIIYFILVNWGIIKREFSKIKKTTWIYLLLIFLLALFTRIIILEHHHIMYIDEPIYMESAKNLFKENKPLLCEYIGLEKVCRIYKKPLGWPVLLSYAFMVAGINNYVALNFSAILGSLSVALMFLFAYLVSRKGYVGLISSFILAIFPLHIRFSKSAETNIPSLFFVLVALIMFMIFAYNKNSIEMLFLSFISLLFATMIRIENMVLIIPMMLLVCTNKVKVEIKKPAFLFIVILFLVSLPQLIQSYINNTNIYGGSFFSIKLIYNNVLEAFSIVTANFNFVLVVLLFIGVWIVFSRQKWLLIQMLAILLPFFIVYTAFQKMQARFFLVPIISVIVIASWGFCLLDKSKGGKIIGAILLSLIVISLFPDIVSSLQPVYPHQLETKIPELIEKEVAHDCYIVTEWPTIITSTTDLKVMSTRNALDNPELFDSFLKQTECVLFLEDSYCLENPDESNDMWRCRDFLKKFNFTKVRTFKGGELQFNLYKIS